LARDVQSVLSEDLALPKYRAGPHALDGHSYAASEAFRYLEGGDESGLQPMHLTHAGMSHWWLQTDDGEIIDITLVDDEVSSFPYEQGKPKRFLRGSSGGGLSWRAAEIVERVERARGRRRKR
jgi:hypothetical protein